MWCNVVCGPKQKVLEEAHQAQASGGEDENAILHNMTATLGAICGLLCVVSASAMVAHTTPIMSQAMLFQALTAPGLVLCGVLLFESNVTLAIGAWHINYSTRALDMDG